MTKRASDGQQRAVWPGHHASAEELRFNQEVPAGQQGSDLLKRCLVARRTPGSKAGTEYPEGCQLTKRASSGQGFRTARGPRGSHKSPEEPERAEQQGE